jgi:RNA polymerase sigma-70 factor, ECF subfamily
MHLDGLSYREMSEVLGISENHVGVKLNRIRSRLAEQLKGAMHEL